MSIESFVKLMTAGPERFDNIFVFINLENRLRSRQPERIATEGRRDDNLFDSPSRGPGPHYMRVGHRWKFLSQKPRDLALR